MLINYQLFWIFRRPWYMTINPEKIHFRAMTLLPLDLCVAVLLFLLDNLAAADVTC